MDYVRMAGLKLMLLAVSMGALAASVPVAADATLADAAWGGMKLLHLILGTAAAGASLFFLPQFSGRALGATISCGILCAVGGTPALTWAFSAYYDKALPGPVENVLAIALGVGGVYIVPGIQRLWESFRANPLGFLDWIRTRGAPPPPPDEKVERP